MRRVKSSRLAIVAAYAGCVLIWGTTWLGIKISLLGFSAITGAGLRFVLAGAFLYALAPIFGVDVRRTKPPLHLVVVLATTMFGINYALTYLAETHLASGLVAVIFGTLPFFTFVFAHALIDERAHRTTIVGAVLALGGVAIISLVGDVRADALYVLAALAAAASSAFANVYLKRYADAEPLATLPPAMLLAGVVMATFGFRFEAFDAHRAFALAPLGALGYLAVFGSATTFYLNHWLLKRIDSGRMGLSALMIPVLAVIVGAVFGHEVLGVRDLVGALLVVLGVSLSMRRVGASTSPVALSSTSPVSSATPVSLPIAVSSATPASSATPVSLPTPTARSGEGAVAEAHV